MMRQTEIDYLTATVERAKERRKTWFGEKMTTKAQVAEVILAAYGPTLLAEVKELRAALARHES